MAKHESVVLHLALPEQSLWAALDTSTSSTQPVVDAAFVDEETLAILARSPRALDVAIDASLDTVFVAFGHLHLQLNSNPVKMEALLQYRGKSAKAR